MVASEPALKDGRATRPRAGHPINRNTRMATTTAVSPPSSSRGTQLPSVTLSDRQHGDPVISPDSRSALCTWVMNGKLDWCCLAQIVDD